MGMDYDRLLQAAKELRGWTTPADVSAGLSKSGYEVSAQMLTNWQSRGVSKEGRLKASAVIGCRPLWIETGAGEMRDGPNVEPFTYKDRKIPIISYVQAGIWRDIVDTYPVGHSDETVSAKAEYGLHTFALRIQGNSMEPEFKEGDIVVIDPDVVPRPGDYVVAKNHAEEATFKKYRPRGISETGEEVFELVPLNDDYAIMRSDTQPIKIIGTMVESTRFRR